MAVDPKSVLSVIKKCEKPQTVFFLSLSELSASISWLFCFLILLPARQSELSWRVVGTRMNKTCVLGIVGRVRVCGPPIRSFVVHIRLYVHFGDVIVCKFA